MSDLPGARSFKSSRSTGKEDCVEVAHLSKGMVGVCDSKHMSGPVLVCVHAERVGCVHRWQSRRSVRPALIARIAGPGQAFRNG
ncbi:DUF397 domain-containing protein [Nocardia sp. NBC_00508]|uniref:DUF397 domain-containing protein n=1 Tax=Nocardia sp. NBC_00508 TaxID=2975992 RepID=UPI002E816487|nr:DUF397 domain-containing protein [Nocardia sp. NBC_00508]